MKPITAPKTSTPTLSTPATRSYSSASDSDETDDERRTMYAQKIKEQQAKKALSKSKKAAVKKVIVPESDSDSDEPNQKERFVKPTKKFIKTSKYLSNSDDSDQEKNSSDANDTTIKEESIKFNPEQRSTSHLVNNRISFRKKRTYDASLTPAENVTDRLSDLFVPQVSDNFFISDSDSETDSGEDYEVKEYPSWQRNLDKKHNKEKDPWPTQRKFGYSDTLKLEKRIKKICRVNRHVQTHTRIYTDVIISSSAKESRLAKYKKSLQWIVGRNMSNSFKKSQSHFQMFLSML